MSIPYPRELGLLPKLVIACAVVLIAAGVIATARIILLGIAMDLLYQLLVFDTFFPAEALIIAVLLAHVPYLVVRVLFIPILRRWSRRASAGETPRVECPIPERVQNRGLAIGIGVFAFLAVLLRLM